MSTNNSLLAISGLTVSFGGLRALSDVALEVKPGEVVGLIGPNGAGKTTAFNAICGLVKPDSGELFLDGHKHSWPQTDHLTELGIARTLQGVGLFGELTVLENVMIGAQKFSNSGLISAALGRTSKDEKVLRERAQTALERVYATGIADRRADTLSYPDTKRVAIARALVSEPKILMLDEPAAGISPTERGRLVDLLKSLDKEMTLVLIEHDMAVALAVADEVIVMHDGTMFLHGSPDEVRSSSAVRDLYLGRSHE